MRQCACDFHHRLPGIVGGFSARTFKLKLNPQARFARDPRDRQTRTRPNPPNPPAAPPSSKNFNPENWFSLEPLGPKGSKFKTPPPHLWYLGSAAGSSRRNLHPLTGRQALLLTTYIYRTHTASCSGRTAHRSYYMGVTPLICFSILFFRLGFPVLRRGTLFAPTQAERYISEHRDGVRRLDATSRLHLRTPSRPARQSRGAHPL